MSKEAFLLITGASSGLGREVALRLAAAGPLRMILPVRDASRGKKLRDDLALAGCSSVTTPILDLASLDSVRRFIDSFKVECGGGRLTGVLLNAGVQSARSLTRTVDGIETTFAVNHLAHHLLLTELLPYLAADAIVGWTASGTHDPAERTAKLSGFRGAQYEAAALLAGGQYPAGSAAQRSRDAYATSKLCNILSARHFARSEKGARRYFSFDPGLMPGTGLAREQGSLALVAWNHVLPLLVPILPGTSSPSRSGTVLASLGLGLLRFDKNGSYIDHRGKPREPFLPRDEEFLLDDLVRTSDRLVCQRAGSFRPTAAEPATSSTQTGPTLVTIP